MTKCNETTLPPATLAAIIDHARETGQVTRKALAFAAECSEEMIRRWEGKQLPKLRPFRRLVSRANLLPQSFKQMLLEWFLRGTGWQVVPSAESDRMVLDVNGDKIVDARDTLALQIKAACETGKAMELLVTAVDDGLLTEGEKAEVRSSLHELRQHVQHAIDSLDFTNNPVRLAK